MSTIIPTKIRDYAVNLLARPEWYTTPGVVRRANLSLHNWYGRFLNSNRFSGREDLWAITLGPTIYICMPDAFDIHSFGTPALLAHELENIEQYEREGVANFFANNIQSYRKSGYNTGRLKPKDPRWANTSKTTCEPSVQQTPPRVASKGLNRTPTIPRS